MKSILCRKKARAQGETRLSYLAQNVVSFTFLRFFFRVNLQFCHFGHSKYVSFISLSACVSRSCSLILIIYVYNHLHEHKRHFFECQRKTSPLRPIYSYRTCSRDLPCVKRREGRGRMAEKKMKRGCNKNITFRDGATKSARETSGSFSSVLLALFSSSDRMFIFRKIDRNETRDRSRAVSSRV